MIGENTISTEYSTKNLDDFLNEMGKARQDMGIEETFVDPEPEPNFETGDDPDSDGPEIQVKTAPARATAKLITTVIDSTIPSTLAFIAKSDIAEYKASEDEREELTEALTEYVKLKGGDIPPGVMVVILVCVIYGTKVPAALQQRKLNDRQEMLEKREKELDLREKEMQIFKNSIKEDKQSDGGEES